LSKQITRSSKPILGCNQPIIGSGATRVWIVRKKKNKALTCPSENNGTGASTEGVIGGAFSLTFLTALLGGGGTIYASSEDTDSTCFVDAVFSKLIFALF
jgi:hypothetical protein